MKYFSKVALLGAALSLFAFVGKSQASSSTTLDILVSISSTKEVLTIGSTYYDFGQLSINASSNSASAITLRNNSTALVETYTIKGSTAISDSAGTDWVLASSTNSTGVDTYALAAEFSGSRPSNTEASWLQDSLNKDTAVTCTTTVLGDGTAGDEGAGVNPGADRTLWFRLTTPTATNDIGSHTARITVSVL